MEWNCSRGFTISLFFPVQNFYTLYHINISIENKTKHEFVYNLSTSVCYNLSSPGLNTF